MQSLGWCSSKLVFKTEGMILSTGHDQITKCKRDIYMVLLPIYMDIYMGTYLYQFFTKIMIRNIPWQNLSYILSAVFEKFGISK